jgi:hypothetical protein
MASKERSHRVGDQRERVSDLVIGHRLRNTDLSEVRR